MTRISRTVVVALAATLVACGGGGFETEDTLGGPQAGTGGGGSTSAAGAPGETGGTGALPATGGASGAPLGGFSGLPTGGAPGGGTGGALGGAGGTPTGGAAGALATGGTGGGEPPPCLFAEVVATMPTTMLWDTPLSMTGPSECLVIPGGVCNAVQVVNLDETVVSWTVQCGSQGEAFGTLGTCGAPELGIRIQAVLTDFIEPWWDSAEQRWRATVVRHGSRSVAIDDAAKPMVSQIRDWIIPGVTARMAAEYEQWIEETRWACP